MKSIRIRLIASMAVLIAFFALQAIAVTWFTNAQSVQTSALIRTNTQSSAQLTELATLAQQIRRYEKEYFVYVQNEEKRNGYIKEFDGASVRIGKLIDAILANTGGAYSKADISEINRWRDAHAFYASEMTRIFNEVRRIQADVAAAPAPAPAPAAAGKATPAATAAQAPVAQAPKLPTPAEANDLIKAGKDRFGAELIAGVNKMGKAKTEATLGLAQGTTEGYQQLLSVVVATVLAGIAIAVFLIPDLAGGHHPPDPRPGRSGRHGGAWRPGQTVCHHQRAGVRAAGEIAGTHACGTVGADAPRQGQGRRRSAVAAGLLADQLVQLVGLKAFAARRVVGHTVARLA
jgi:hypothetical protein